MDCFKPLDKSTSGLECFRPLDKSTSGLDSFKPLDKSTSGFSQHAHTSGYQSMLSESTIPMDTRPLEKPKMDPVIEMQEATPPAVVAPMMAPQIPVAGLPPPTPLGGLAVPQTPQNQGKGVATTPMVCVFSYVHPHQLVILTYEKSNVCT